MGPGNVAAFENPTGRHSVIQKKWKFLIFDRNLLYVFHCNRRANVAGKGHSVDKGQEFKGQH